MTCTLSPTPTRVNKPRRLICVHLQAGSHHQRKTDNAADSHVIANQTENVNQTPTHPLYFFEQADAKKRNLNVKLVKVLIKR